MVRITFIFLMIGVRAYAVPTLYPENFNRQLRNTTNSNVVADTKDSARFYVLPPIKSAATIQDLHTITANVGFCEEIANLQRYNADTIKVLNSLKVKSREAQRVLDADNLKLKNSEAAYLSFVKTHNVSELDALFIARWRRANALRSSERAVRFRRGQRAEPRAEHSQSRAAQPAE